MKRLGVRIAKIDPGEDQILFAANGGRIRVVGKVSLTIKVGGLNIPYDFLVVNQLTQNLILGINFLQFSRALINLDKQIVTFYDHLVEVNILSKTRDVIACLDSEQILQPRTENLVKVCLSQPIWGQSVMLEPLSMRERQKYLVAKILVKPEGKYSFVKILNPTDQNLTLRRHLQIAKVQQIEEKSITLYDDGTDEKLDTSNSNTQVEDSNNRQIENTQSINSITQTSSADNNKKGKTLEELGLKIDNANLTAEQRLRLTKLLEDNTDVFALTLGDLGSATSAGYCHIETGNAQAIRQRAYRPSPKAREEISKQTQEMLDHGIIVESDSSWASPIILVRKKDNSMRFCIDYRKLNSVSQKQQFPLPLLTDVWDCLAQNHSSVYSILDLRSGYYQIALDEESKAKTAFITQDGVYHYTRMPFGIQGGPAVFQRIMNQVFRNLNFRTLLVYIDDVMIFSKDFDTHIQALKEVFQRLRNAGLKLHPKKCSFAKEKITYLGHTIGGKGVSIDESKLSVVKNWPIPKNVRDVRAVLGFFQFYRKFIKKFQ